MTKAISEIRKQFHAPRPASEALTFNQKLQAADEAWQNFIRTQVQPEDGSCVPQGLSMLSTFSRFLHELIPDQQIRGHLLREFEQQFMQTGAFKQEALQ